MRSRTGLRRCQNMSCRPWQDGPFLKAMLPSGFRCLLVFYSMLHTGELLGLQSSHLLCTVNQRQALISLGLTKGGKRQGASESVILGYAPAVCLVECWIKAASSVAPLAKNPANWRGLFNEAINALKLDKLGFRPYSLRRGGATF